jgi:glutamate decarboxylase
MSLDDVYAAPGFRAPQTAFPSAGLDSRAAYALVHDELMLDGAARLNLATFCTTWVESEVKQLLTESFDKNIVDKDEYPRTADLERRCVRMLADLWHAPEPSSTRGTSTAGSSEAAMLGGLAARWRWRAAGRGTGRPNFVCGPVQVCWEKFARYFDVEIRQVPLRGSSLFLHPSDLAAHCDENTIMVVATLGQTFTGLYEDVHALSAALDRLQADTGLDIPLHVDAASGGFLAPFCAPDLVWDFRLPRVKSINASGHKTGLAPLGLGWAIWRSAPDLPDELIFNVDYLGGNMPTFNLNFSRPGSQVIAQYYNFVRLGRPGYQQVQSAIYEVASYVASGVAELGPFSLLFDGSPSQGITAVSWRLAAPGPFSLYDFADRMRAHGWLIAAYPLPADRQEENIQRAVFRHGFSLEMADILLGDMRRSLDQLTRRPPAISMTRADAPSFTHDASPAVSLT